MNIPVVPKVAAEAIRICRDPETASMNSLCEVIECDQKLTLDIIKLSNVAMHALESEVVDLHQAIRVLGFRRCLNLIVSSCIQGLADIFPPEHQPVRDRLWKHGYETAIIAAKLNCEFKLGFKGEEFTCGLTHDIGRTLFACVFCDEYADIDPLSVYDDGQILRDERRLIGVDHAELGAWYIIQNELPEFLVQPVLYHHQPARASKYKELVALISVADHMANHLQRYDVAIGYKPETNHALSNFERLRREDCLLRFDQVSHSILEQAIEQTNRRWPKGMCDTSLCRVSREQDGSVVLEQGANHITLNNRQLNRLAETLISQGSTSYVEVTLYAADKGRHDLDVLVHFGEQEEVILAQVCDDKLNRIADTRDGVCQWQTTA